MPRNLTVGVIVCLIFSYAQPVWADVDGDILRGMENKLERQIDRDEKRPNYSSWIKIANEIDNLIQMKCRLKSLSENCKKLTNLFIEKSKDAFEKSSRWQLRSDVNPGDAKKFQQKAMKIFSYGKSHEEKQGELKRLELEPFLYQSCNKPVLPINPKDVDACLPGDLLEIIMDYASYNDIELKSFTECAKLDQNKLKHFNIHFSSEMKKIITNIFRQHFPVERPKHFAEENWEHIKNCFKKFKGVQATHQGIKGVDLDFRTDSKSNNTFSGEKSLGLLEQYFISRNLKHLTIGPLVEGDLNTLFD